jgi:hypothetical protein
VTELLNISTVVERDTVTIRSKKHPAGKAYDLVNIEELGAFEYEIIVSRHAKVGKLAHLTRKMTAAEQREINKALADILKLLVIGLEPTVLTEMESAIRARIVTAWAVKHGAAEGEAPAGRPKRKPRKRTTAGSSRASRRSTAATRKSGSTSRRGR